MEHDKRFRPPIQSIDPEIGRKSDLLYDRHPGAGRDLPVIARYVSRERPRPSPG